MNPTGTKVICFSRFFYAFLCLCCFQTRVRVLFFVCVGSLSFGVGIPLRLSCWIPNSVRKVLASFEIFSQPAGPVGKSNQPVHWVQFSETIVWVLFFVYIGSWSFRVGIAIRLSCWIPDFVKKVLKIFEIFSQPDEPVGKSNQPLHSFQFAGMAVLVLCLVCVGSWPFRVGIALRLSCWILDSMRQVLKIFEIFSPPSGLVGKPNQPVHWVKFSETSIWVLCFVCIGSWSFGVRIALLLSCWILYFLRKVLKIFEIFSQPAGPVGKLNQSVHLVQFAGKAVWVLCLVCGGS